MSPNIPDKYNYKQFLVAYEELQFSSSKLNHKANNIPSNDNYHQILPSFLAVVWCNVDTVIPRYNAPRYNADLAITRFFTPKVFLPHLLRKGKFSAKFVNISL